MNKSVVQDISSAVGTTPLVRLNHFSTEFGVEIFAKLESTNPLGSVKDRVALAMINDAEKAGILMPGATIIEPTSGNTGIGLAFLSASRGYRLVLTMPESMSIERRKLLKHLGAELVLTPAAKGMKGAVERAQELQQATPGSWLPNQFENPSNPAMHRKTTGPELVSQLAGQADYFIAGVGTGGTITGAGGYLKENIDGLQVIAVEPEESPVLSGGSPGPHKIQGIGAGFIPDILDRSVIDEVIQVTGDAAINAAQELAKKEGILGGISCGAALAAAFVIAGRQEDPAKRLVVVLPDTGERYLSTDLFPDEA